MKKTISIILSVLMLMGVFTGVQMTASAAELKSGSCGGNVKYTFEKSTGTLTISGSGEMLNYRKRSLSPFYQHTEIKSVVVKSGVKNIGDNIFYDCSEITSLTLPSGITYIGENAFWYCNKLNTIKIPATVKRIGYNAFTYTGYYYNEKNWDNGVLYIDNCVVATNDVLCGNYTLNSKTRLIAKSAFKGAIDLTGITVPANVKLIDDGTFSDCTDLKTANIKGAVTYVGESAFFNCKSLTKLTFKNGLKTIGKYAFNCCDALKTISLPKTVKKIGFAAFYPCSSLKHVYYASTKADFDKIKIEKSNGPFTRAKLHCTDDIKTLKVKAKKNSFKASWTKSKGAKSYELQYSLKKDFTKAKTVKAKKNTATVKKLKKNKKYYVRVRAVRGKQRSQWTLTKAVKVK